MKSSLGQYCINVSDLERSVRFYEEGLGLQVHSRTDVNENCKEAIMHCPDEGAWLQLAHHLDREGEIDHGNAFWKLYVNTNDCKGLFEKAVAAGAKPTMDPTPLDKWPVTIAFVADPDGYAVEIVEMHAP